MTIQISYIIENVISRSMYVLNKDNLYDVIE